jgi:hypothetical protein
MERREWFCWDEWKEFFPSFFKKNILSAGLRPAGSGAPARTPLKVEHV